MQTRVFLTRQLRPIGVLAWDGLVGKGNVRGGEREAGNVPLAYFRDEDVPIDSPRAAA